MKNKLFIFFVLSICFSFIQQTKILKKNLYKNTKTYNLTKQETLYLKDYMESDKLQLFVFHSVRCPFNRIYESHLDILSSKEKEVIVTYINSNPLENTIAKPDPKLLKYIEQRENNYLLDQNRFLKQLFGVDKNGIVILCKQEETGIKIFYKGPIDDSPQSNVADNNFLDTAIKNALKGVKTSNKQIKTGCRILNH